MIIALRANDAALEPLAFPYLHLNGLVRPTEVDLLSYPLLINNCAFSLLETD